MRINWVVADSTIIDPSVDIDRLKALGPMWGGWKTWRSCSTDNVVCHDIAQARNLVNNNFHTRCNLHIPADAYQELDRPSGVKLYQGNFTQLIDRPDEIVSMHLASSVSDIVMLLGFELLQKPEATDKLNLHKYHNYTNYFRQIIESSNPVQWVLLDQAINKDNYLTGLTNIQFDNLSNIL
jgi:hypothetical protein